MNPTPEQVKQARVKAGLTQQKAADLINCGIRSWQKWEAGDRKMHPAMWELFLIKTEVEL
jgi:DNA-binding transcriptional regulator YiaG